MAIKKYFDVYRSFVTTAIAGATQFRVNFILLIIMDLIFYFVSLESVSFIFDHVEQIGPWSKNQFLFFVSFLLAVDQLHMALISENFWNFSFEIRTGRLDFALLKPIGAIFIVFFRHVRPASMLNLPAPWACLVYYGLRVDLSVGAWCWLPFLVVLALAILTSVEILISMVMFVTVESYGINFLRMQLQNISRWPDFIYRYFFQKVFTFLVPVLAIGSVPVRFLFEEFSPGLIAQMLLTLGVFSLLVSVFWRWGLKKYESASS